MKNKIFLILVLFFFSLNVYAWSLIGPSSFEDCRERSAKEAKTRYGLTILLQKCNTEFPARKNPDGTYSYYDAETNTSITVSGPKPTKSDWDYIQSVRNNFRSAQIEQARKTDETLNLITVEKWGFTCGYNCMEKHISVTVKNNSSNYINYVGFGWIFGDRNIDCNASMAQSGGRNVNIPPKQKATLSFSTYDGADGRVTGCIGVTSVQIQ